MAPFEMCAPESRLPVCAGMNALAGQRLDVEAVDHIDLLLQRLQRLQRLAELHGGARAFGAPVIFVDAAAQEHHAEALGESGWRRRIGEGVERFQPRQRHGAAGAAKHGAAGNARSGIRSSRAFVDRAHMRFSVPESVFRNCGLVTMVSTSQVMRYSIRRQPSLHLFDRRIRRKAGASGSARRRATCG